MCCSSETVKRGARLHLQPPDHRANARDLWPADRKYVVSGQFHLLFAVENGLERPVLQLESHKTVRNTTVLWLFCAKIPL